MSQGGDLKSLKTECGNTAAAYTRYLCVAENIGFCALAWPACFMCLFPCCGCCCCALNFTASGSAAVGSMAPICIIGKTMGALEQMGGAEVAAAAMRGLSILVLAGWHASLSNEVVDYNSCLDEQKGQSIDDENCPGANTVEECCEYNIWDSIKDGDGESGLDSYADEAEYYMDRIVPCLILFAIWFVVSIVGGVAGLSGSAAESKYRKEMNRQGISIEIGRLNNGAVAASEANVRVRLPNGTQPGQTMSILGPNGQPLNFQVPPGARGGHVLTINVPPPRAPQMAQPTAQPQPMEVVAVVVDATQVSSTENSEVPLVEAQLVQPPSKGRQQQAPIMVQGTVVGQGSSLDGPRGNSLDRRP